MSRLSSLLNKEIGEFNIDWSIVGVLVFIWLTTLGLVFIDGGIRYLSLVLAAPIIYVSYGSSGSEGVGHSIKELVRTSREFILWQWKAILATTIVLLTSLSLVFLFIFLGVE